MHPQPETFEIASWSLIGNMDGSHGLDEVQVVRLADGTLAAGWCVGDGGWSYHVQVSMLRPGRSEWSTPVDVSQTGSYDTRLKLAPTADGGLIAVWCRRGNASCAVQVATFDVSESQWSAPTTLVSQRNLDYPTVAVAEDGSAVIAWLQHNEYGPTEAQAAWRPAGNDNREQFKLLPTIANVNAVQVFAGADGTLGISCSPSHPERSIRVATRQGGSETWDQPVNIPSPDGFVVRLDLAAGPTGRVVLTWDCRENGKETVWASVWESYRLGWSTPVLLSAAAALSGYSTPIASPDGRFAVFWRDGDNRNSGIKASLLPPESERWSPPIDVTDETIGGLPYVAVTDSGTFATFWSSARTWRIRASIQQNSGEWSAPLEMQSDGQPGVPAPLGLSNSYAVAFSWSPDGLEISEWRARIASLTPSV